MQQAYSQQLPVDWSGNRDRWLHYQPGAYTAIDLFFLVEVVKHSLRALNLS